MRSLLPMLALGWYLILRTQDTGLTLGPYDSKEECRDVAEVMVPILSHLGVELAVVVCAERREA